MVRGVAVEGGVDENGRGEAFDRFVTKVGGGGFPMSVVVAFQKGEEKL
jgi:hypothetical protein